MSQSDLNETVNILNLRVNGLGVSGAQVQTTGKNQISVSIPGVTDAQQVLNQIGQTARMFFRPVECFAYPQGVPKGSKAKVQPRGIEAIPPCSSSNQLTAANLNVQPNSNVPAGYTSNNVPPDTQYVAYPSTSVLQAELREQHGLAAGPGRERQRQRGRALCARPERDDGPLHRQRAGDAEPDRPVGGQLHRWRARRDRTCGTRSPSRTSTSCSASSWTGSCIRRPSSSPPSRASPRSTGKGEISGSLTQGDAQNLAQAMNFGALPVTLKAATSETVSATLGHSALVAGLGAGIAGLILVLLYVLLYYRVLGLVVISGLVLTAMMLWAIISALGHTSVAPSFDLAGITGLIVSIGITVDSYIVYFERLKDETRSGRSVRTSVDRGFKSAWRTVWAADFVSLLAAIVLYLVAVGNVKGFAFFLGLSTIMDMAVTWFYTRPLVILLGQSTRLQGSGAFSIATGLGAGPQGQAQGQERGVPVGAAAGGGS